MRAGRAVLLLSSLVILAGCLSPRAEEPGARTSPGGAGDPGADAGAPTPTLPAAPSVPLPAAAQELADDLSGATGGTPLGGLPDGTDAASDLAGDAAATLTDTANTLTGTTKTTTTTTKTGGTTATTKSGGSTSTTTSGGSTSGGTTSGGSTSGGTTSGGTTSGGSTSGGTTTGSGTTTGGGASDTPAAGDDGLPVDAPDEVTSETDPVTENETIAGATPDLTPATNATSAANATATNATNTTNATATNATGTVVATLTTTSVPQLPAPTLATVAPATRALP